MKKTTEQPSRLQQTVSRHRPGIVRGLITGIILVLVALILQKLERQRNGQSPTPHERSPATRPAPLPAPLPSNTALRAPQDTHLPAVVFVYDATTAPNVFPDPRLLEALRKQAPGRYQIRIEHLPLPAGTPPVEANIKAPAVLILNPDGTRRTVLRPPVSLNGILDALKANGTPSKEQPQERTP